MATSTVKGAALDTRLQSKLLLDPKLQRRLSGDEFRSFINLLVWVVGQVSDGVFAPDDAEMAVQDVTHIDRMVEVGVVDRDDSGLHRIHPDYWSWQSSKAQLQKMADDRARDAERKRKARATRDDADDLVAEAPFST